MSFDLQPVLAHLESDRAGARERLFDFLRIPSISTDPAHRADCAAAAAWCVADLHSCGFNASVRNTAGHPMVVGTRAGPPGAPHILFYGHYDVQPVDPIELWRHGPFEPTLENGPHGPRVVARGAVDDKGEVAAFFEACRAWQKVHGALPCGVTVFLEGEEESGSPSLESFLAASKADLKADVCVVADTGMWDIDTPSITAMLRGLALVEVVIHGPSRDVHSGLYGGAIPNPALVLASILAQMHDEHRRVQLDGFYDSITPLGNRIREMWAKLPNRDKQFLGSVGVSAPYGEDGYGTLERTWSRPTLEVNGIYGGYTGPGSKTVIGALAGAKISCRLVPGQDPARVVASLKQFVLDRLPSVCRAEFIDHGASPAIQVPDESPWLRAASAAMRGIMGRDTLIIGSGGSIPAVGAIKRHLGVDSILVGFGLDDDAVHSPNEKFEMRCFETAARCHAAILSQIGALRA